MARVSRCFALGCFVDEPDGAEVVRLSARGSDERDGGCDGAAAGGTDWQGAQGQELEGGQEHDGQGR